MDQRRPRGKQVSLEQMRSTVHSERPSSILALMTVLSRVSGIPGNKHLRAVDPHSNCVLTGIFNYLEHSFLQHFGKTVISVSIGQYRSPMVFHHVLC